ncbi:low molecular weight phosphotyrosine protein phosphatase [Vibrio parahaemolyticus]|uniref:low molecular weight protein-tyrosine-phosphatase n=1 Tax=Vibrio parahaemolyticus TaxID=670 RepID=UPI001121544C|nr:low molecular weight protein-tyrosine-phosphatase [Vibrio parahaemolyticus]EGQ7676991.1 low molecular weight phosphotyrosine protein phosphatase [Vibrio parahaemolyticus]EGQ9219564.1 low molecular weight phosphotyrosine protein phosphatase [Vibrio parahaemolyticus]ELA7272421.1 low molecular weight phosphotyrosine protein phosphatase [Vibrio parahaemolyticus]ELA7279615.1 low molecular weight phosphotyrosine protein phosphatase [Vibrio parahaemolyticus]ELA7339697.1 low molecular weight phosph
MFSNILVVCVGNICRSPTGERLLQQLLPDKQISSAGIAVEKSRLTGKPADETARLVASERGIYLLDHKAQQLTAQLCAKQDLILVMEQGHIDALTELVPEARGKAMLFGHWIGSVDIPDPYRQSREAFEHALSLIENAAHAWVKKI